MPIKKGGGYDLFDSFDEAKAYYRLRRKMTYFILSDDGVKALDPVCARCRCKIQDPPNGAETVEQGYDANRCVYFPKTKKCAALHYLCAWENAMGAVYGTEALI
jgi:hypothetical protein